MKQGIFAVIMFLLALLGFASFFGLILNFDPFTAGAGIIVLVYLTIFFGLTGLLSLIIFWIKQYKQKEYDIEKNFWVGVVVSLVIVGGLAVLANI